MGFATLNPSYALYTVWYNFIRQHETAPAAPPAMAAVIRDKLWSMTDLAEMIEATLGKPEKRGPYRKAAAL